MYEEKNFMQMLNIKSEPETILGEQKTTWKVLVLNYIILASVDLNMKKLIKLLSYLIWSVSMCMHVCSNKTESKMFATIFHRIEIIF